MQHSTLSFIAVLFTLATGQRLNKPPLEQSLDYLQQGLLDNLQPVPSTQQQWPAGQIPADCKSMTEGAGLSANDVQTFSVTYNDVNKILNLPSPRSVLIDVSVWRPLGSLPSHSQPRPNGQHDRPLWPRTSAHAPMGPPHDCSTRSFVYLHNRSPLDCLSLTCSNASKRRPRLQFKW